jgi:UDP-GlcNAc:undecaprenyl-phosphate GlcNAc-1-phosphate transferase
MRWYDTIDHRKFHSGNIPRIGGVGIFTASILAVIMLLVLQQFSSIFPNLSTAKLLPLLFSLLLIHVVGLLDDFANLRPLYKLYGQLIAALIPVATGTYFTALELPFYHTAVELSWAGPVLTVLWLVGVTNAVNLIDGIDGLSSSLTVIAAVFLGFCAVSEGITAYAGIAFAVAGAAGAFFLFNYPPAKLFMGDAGSLYLGFVLALLPLYIFAAPGSAGAALPVGLSLLLIPIMDTIAAIVRRRRQKKSFHIPDKEHLHHKLLNFGFTNKEILVMMAGVNVIPSATAYLWIRTGTPLFWDITFVLWILVGCGFLVVDRFHRRIKVSIR